MTKYNFKLAYEGIRHGFLRRQTMVHNPSTGLFELKYSPIQSPTVSTVRRLRGTAHATNKHPTLTGTDSQSRLSDLRHALMMPKDPKTNKTLYCDKKGVILGYPPKKFYNCVISG